MSGSAYRDLKNVLSTQNCFFIIQKKVCCRCPTLSWLKERKREIEKQKMLVSGTELFLMCIYEQNNTQLQFSGKSLTSSTVLILPSSEMFPGQVNWTLHLQQVLTYCPGWGEWTCPSGRETEEPRGSKRGMLTKFLILGLHLLLPVVRRGWVSHVWGRCTLTGVDVMALCTKQAAAVEEGWQRSCDGTFGSLKINAYGKEICEIPPKSAWLEAGQWLEVWRKCSYWWRMFSGMLVGHRQL